MLGSRGSRRVLVLVPYHFLINAFNYLLARGCAYAAELRLDILLAVALLRVVGVDFRWSMPAPL